jgi:murein DD-endopeptidase MepM/ murein hydrolase activator NlpD
MREFFAEFIKDPLRTVRVIFIDDEGTGEPRQHRVVPMHVSAVLLSAVVASVLLTVAIVAFTPLRELIPGYSTEEMRSNARLNALRLAALTDSLEIQSRYLEHLRNLMTGQIVAEDFEGQDGIAPVVADLADEELRLGARVPSENWRDHTQPAFNLDVLPDPSVTRSEVIAVSEGYLASLRFPVVLPVEGILTRGFAADIGHYGIDIAASEGSVVRSIGDGYVILADWTHDGGHAIAIQHARGYISVYKHNQRLLKNVGDRVRDREPIALSGNSGEITTGPHLHFELWHDGLAQDANAFFLSP